MMMAHTETMERVKQDPSIAVKALERYLQLTPEVAQRFYDLHSGDKMPSFAEQLDPNSPYSLVSKQGGLAGQLHLASEMLAKAGTIPQPLSSSEERRVGKESVRTCRYRWSRYHKNKKTTKQ